MIKQNRPAEIYLRALPATSAVLLLSPLLILFLLTPSALAQDASSAMPADTISASGNDTSPLDPAGQAPSAPPVNFNLPSNSADSMNANVMSIFGTTDTTPQAGYGSQQSSITGGAGVGGFLSPSTGSSSAGLSSMGDLGSLTKLLTTQTAAAQKAGLTGSGSGTGSGSASSLAGAAGGAQPGSFANDGTFLDDGSKSGQGALPGDESIMPGGESQTGAEAPPGADEAQKQAEALAREEGRIPENERSEGRRQNRSEQPKGGFFSVLPDSPARTALYELRQGRYESALEHLKRLYSLNPHAVELQYLMGVACVMTQRPTEAEQHYRHVLESPQASAQLKQLAATGLRRLQGN